MMGSEGVNDDDDSKYTGGESEEEEEQEQRREGVGKCGRGEVEKENCRRFERILTR
jgi:hypothetical protein